MPLEIAYNLSGLSDRQKLQKFKASHDAVAAKPLVYVTPNPPLATVIGDHNDALALLDQIDALEQQLVTLRDNRDTAMVLSSGNHHTLGAYVLTTAAGNSAVVTDAAYDVAQPPVNAPVVPLGQVQGNMIIAGVNDGAAQGKWEKLAGSKSYEVQTATSPSGSWTHHSTVTNNSVDFTGQTSGAKLWTRVRAINKLGPGPWSDPACCTIP